MIKRYPEYKDSGIEWLKKVPLDWPIAKFKRFGKIRNGKDQKTVLAENGEYPVLGTGGEFGRAKEYLYDKPSVLLGRKGTIDKPQYIEEPFWTVDTLFYTEVFEENSPKFLYYFSTIFPFSLLQESSAVPSMTQGKLHNLELCKPSFEEQNKIAEYLDHQTGLIDAIIEKKQQLIDKLKEQRQAIINEAVTKGLVPNAPMKNSGVEWIGNIPQHWTVKKMKYLSPVKRGASPRPIADPKYFSDKGEFGWVRIADVSASERYLEKTTDQLSELGASLSVKRLPGDFFLSIAGSVGKPIITKIKCCIHDGFVWFPELKINPEFLYYLFSNNLPFQGLGKLGTQLNLNTDTIGNIEIPVMEPKEMDEIVEYLDKCCKSLDITIEKNLLVIERLKHFRQSIISEAVTGKIDVREWEPQIKESV